MATGSSIISSPAVDEKTAYVESTGGLIQAFPDGCTTTQPSCGPTWIAHESGVLLGSPVVSDGSIYTSAGDLFAFRVGCASSGAACTPSWTGRGVGSIGITASPAVADGMVYIGTARGLYAFSVDCAARSCAAVWIGQLGTNVETSSAAVADGVIYIGSEDGRLYAFTAGCATGGATCAPAWTGETGGPVLSSPAVAGGVAYVVSADGQLYAFAVGCAIAAGACQPIWKGTVAAPGSGGASSPAVANGVVYVAGSGGLYAFAVGCANGGQTCSPLWRSGLISDVADESPVVANGLLFVNSVNHLLFAFGL